jgi:hypothetical protein
MVKDSELDWKIVIDRAMLMTLKACPVCGRKFHLGEPVVLADGSWQGPPRWIHEDEAVFDRKTNRYVESRSLADRL